MTTFQTRRLGKYIILDQLAVGGMAELFRAMITSVQGFEKLIAIKKILPHLASEDDLVNSFIDEAKLAALLHHQNIVQIYDFGRLEETYFIAMEYLVGKDCKYICNKAREKNIPLDRQNALLIVSRLCAGLDYAHNLKDFQGKALNIIHRDISPQNILITYEGDVKIVDFGIAKAASQNTHTQMGMIKGKVAYMSPEQAMGKEIDHRSDIFSCGIILYELLTGTRMFTGDTMHILSSIREAEYELPEEFQNDLPEELTKVLNRALQKEPEDRYQSCGDMLNDLEECMQLGTHPSPQGLSKYMKTLFAEEISAEKQHLQKITEIGLQQGTKKSPYSSNSAGTDIKDTSASDKRDRGLTSGDRSVTKKAFFSAVASAIFLVIALVTFFNQKDDKPPTTELEVKTPSIQETVQAEVSGAVPTEQIAVKTGTADTETYQKAMDALIAQRFDEAIGNFKELLALNPDVKNKIASPYAEALVGLANNLSEAEPQKAIDLFTKAIQFEPSNEQAHFQLGMIFMKLENYGAAIESFEKVIEIKPEFPDTYFNLGFINALSKNYIKAEEMYARVVGLRPDYLDEALFNLALVQSRLDKKDESLANLEKAVEINPENKLARNYLKKLKGVSAE